MFNLFHVFSRKKISKKKNHQYSLLSKIFYTLGENTNKIKKELCPDDI